MKPKQISCCEKCYQPNGLRACCINATCVCHNRPDISKKDEGFKERVWDMLFDSFPADMENLSTMLPDQALRLVRTFVKKLDTKTTSEEECPHGAKGKECPVLDCGNSPHPAPKGDWKIDYEKFYFLEYPDVDAFVAALKHDVSQLIAEREKEAEIKGTKMAVKAMSESLDTLKQESTLSAYKVVESWAEKNKQEYEEGDGRKKDYVWLSSLQSFLKDKTK